MKTVISFLIRTIPRKYLHLFSGVGFKILGVFYSGKGVECPVCNHQYRQFFPYGRFNPRPNALCPNCLSLERHRLIWLYLHEKTNFFSTKLHVLHVAPERCFIKAFQKMHGDGYITADLESPLAKVKMDVHAIPFPENHFDVVLCNHVLEHVASDLKAMSELSRVLKPGGWAILQVPFFAPVPDITEEDPTVTDPKQRVILYGQDDHVRKFGRDYADRINRSGFIAKPDHYAAELTPGIAEKFGLMKDEVIFLAVKN